MLRIAGKSQLVRFGPWKNFQQRQIILHIAGAGKCKLAIFGLWKKSERRDITLQISREGEIYLELPENASGQGNYIANCRQIQISQV